MANRFINKEVVRGEDLRQVQLDDEGFTVAFEVEGDNVHRYHHGYGSGDVDSASISFAEADLVASGNGTGTAGDQINGTVRETYYYDEQHERIKKIGRKFTLEELRNPARSEGVPLPMRTEGVADDEHQVLEIKTTASDSGEEVDPTASTAQIPYSQVEWQEWKDELGR